MNKSGFESSLTSGPFYYSESVPTMSWISSPTYGMLKGFVKNSSGNPVYPATVTVSSKSTKDSGTGFYGFVDLSPGTYTVTASAAGYNNATGTVTISAGSVANLNLTLTTGSTTEIILDNPSATYTGTWSTGTSSTDKYGSDYRYAGTATSETCTARWTPSITTAGTYDVYVWYPQGTNRSASAPFTVYWNGGSQTVYVNQQASGGTWNLLVSKKSFATGTSGYVKLGNGTSETSKVVMADAVKFVYSP